MPKDPELYARLSERLEQILEEFKNNWAELRKTLEQPRRDIKAGRAKENTYGYDLSGTLDEIRPTYRFNETCQDTVPQVIIAFPESTGFEDTIRNAISLSGDSDTLAAITGSIAEAAYGISDRIKDKAYPYLDEPLKDVLRRWKKFISRG